MRQGSSHHGVLLVDKAIGSTSFDVVSRVRRALGVRRVGHAGTLDPFATGLLPLCIGESTKAVPFLMGGAKVYQTTFALGVETDTHDIEGKVVSENSVEGVTRDVVEQALEGFIGEIDQVPPQHSAIKVNGRRLYEYARAGEKVEVPPRTVRIDRIELRRLDGTILELEVGCGKGTYIRAIARDLGRALGCGAHVSALRRTQIAEMSVDDAIEEAAILSEAPEVIVNRLCSSAGALGHLPGIPVGEEHVRRFRFGQKIPAHEVDGVPAEGFFRLLEANGTLVAVASVSDGVVRIARGFNEAW